MVAQGAAIVVIRRPMTALTHPRLLIQALTEDRKRLVLENCGIRSPCSSGPRIGCDVTELRVSNADLLHSDVRVLG